MASTPERILRPEQVAEMFGVTTTTVARWADEGLIPSFRTPGGQRRFRRDAIEGVLAAGSPTTEAVS